MTDEVRFLKKKQWWSEFGSNGPKSVFPEIEHDGSLRQCLTSSSAKACQKKIGAQI